MMDAATLSWNKFKINLAQCDTQAAGQSCSEDGGREFIGRDKNQQLVNILFFVSVKWLFVSPFFLV
jgi:hypothetical protein